MSKPLEVDDLHPYEDDDDTVESAARKALSMSQVVVVPADNELFVDIDTEEGFERFMALIPKLDCVSYTVRRSPSLRPGRHHIVVRLRRSVTPIERIAYQAILGSDPIREILSCRRIDRGIAQPTIFFERPQAEPIVVDEDEEEAFALVQQSRKSPAVPPARDAARRRKNRSR